MHFKIRVCIFLTSPTALVVSYNNLLSCFVDNAEFL